jgi:hypothetical protein
MSDSSEKKEEEKTVMRFNLHHVQVSKGTKNKYIADVRMTASFEDLQFWEKVRAKLDGLEIESSETLISEALSMLNDKAVKTQEQLMLVTAQFAAYKEEVASRDSFTRQELGRLRKLEQELNQLAGLAVTRVVD